MKVEDVKLWAIERGIGHAVQRWIGIGWILTACEIMSNMVTTETKPKRICRECRRRLPAATAKSP